MKDSARDLNRIPKEQLTAYERWELPLLDARGNEVAREEEQNVKPLTAADIEAIRAAAREDGYQEGREEGFQAGLSEGRQQGHQEGLDTGQAEGLERGQAEARSEIDAKLDRLEHLLGELMLPIKRHQDELETVLLNLTTVLSRAVVYRELSLDSSQIQRVVRRAIEALPSTADNLRIHVHPGDSDWVREVAARLETGASVIEDDRILPGGCTVETRHSLVDFTVEKRFQRAVQSMLDQQMTGSDAGESEELDSLMGDLTDFHRDVMDSPDQSEDDGDDLAPG